MALENLRIESFSDREFLLVIADHEQDDGWAESLDIAKTGNLRYYRDGRIRHTQRWRLTELGRQMAFGKLRKADETALGRIGNGQMLLVTRWLSERSRGDGGVAKLVQREWRFGHAPRDGTG
jgi:hypothetical protein